MGNIYTFPETLVRDVVERFRFVGGAFSAEEYVGGLQIDMLKADLLHAWARICYLCEGTVVRRLNENFEALSGDELVPPEYVGHSVKGDALKVLGEINEERWNGGPWFARVDNGNLLDLVGGAFITPEMLGRI